MKASESCVALVKEFEGFMASPYQCSAGKWTIGYGNTFYEDGSPVRQSDLPISETRAKELLLNLLNGTFAHGVAKALTTAVNQNQFDAMVCFAYNVGLGNFRSSTLLRNVNTGEFAGAAMEFGKWNKAGGKVLNGLTRRRAAERALFERKA